MPLMNRRIAGCWTKMQVCSLILLSGMTVLLSGCGNFFKCEGKASCAAGGSGGGGNGGSGTDYVYVANSATGSTYLNGYSLSNGTLTAITGSPFSLSYTPSSMAITPANTYLYAASDSTLSSGVGYIYGYSIGKDGALSILSGGTPLVSEDVTSIDVSPDGKWLFALDTNGLTLEEYSINSSTGILTFAQTYGLTGATGGVVTPSSVKVAPSGDFVVVALGTGGAETFAFNTSTGAAAATQLISPASSAIGIYGVAIDSNNDLYTVGTAGLEVFSTTTSGAVTLLNAYLTGNGAHSIVISGGSAYVYVGNETDGTITGYAIGTNAVLTAIAGSPFPAPTTVTALAHDSTNSYLIASGYDAGSGIQLFSIGSTGALALKESAGSGTSTAVPGVIAATY